MPRAKKAAAARTQAKTGRLRKAASSVVRVLSRARKTPAAVGPEASTVRVRRGAKVVSRPARRQPDIPLDQLAQMYTPTQTSLKAGFRASGADRQRDQEFAGGVPDNRWKDEDRLTNKSGDPRIGTHGRTYEPGEKRAARGRNDDKK